MSIERLIRVEAPHFVAALVLQQNPALRWRCVEAAPILKWAIHKSEAQLVEYFHRKGWKFEEVTAP
ncbi:hypothetical protein NKJ06_21140 [Mesorhizobium sp. M0293]|uniref:hypothetical protein n=1 Tax=Mesorhizobium sp. M0293 TaxID=2956930 RepID=UPI00333CEE30